MNNFRKSSRRFIFGLLLAVSVLSLCSSPVFATACREFLLEAPLFRDVFHGLGAAETITSLRQELKAIVPEATGEKFLAGLKKVADESKAKGSTTELKPRDFGTPGTESVTDTLYWPSFKVRSDEDKKLFKAVIRARLYDEVPVGTQVSQLTFKDPVNPVLLADAGYKEGGRLRKLEFKVGHSDEEGLADIPAVVDKTDVVLPEEDIMDLLRNGDSFKQSKNRVLKNGLALKKDMKAVNNSSELQAMIDRIGLLHTSGHSPGAPQTCIRYKRKAFQLSLMARDHSTVVVQITTDREVEIVDLTEGSFVRFNDRDFETGKTLKVPDPKWVVEMKIPLALSEKSEDELKALGLTELAKIRKAYSNLEIVEGSTRNSGKQAHGFELTE